MLPDRAAIASLLPHAGRMCLLERVLSWDANAIACAAVSHLDPDHPLRRAGILPIWAGLEYPLQAAALHGALTDGAMPQAPAAVAALRDVVAHVPRLDEPGFGTLRVSARREHGGPDGALYALCIAAADGRVLLEARATIAFGAWA